MTEQPLWKRDIEELGLALTRFQEILNEPLDKNDFILDACIKRFEFSYEIFWKTLKRLLKQFASEEASYPRLVFQKSYAIQWIGHESAWLHMQSDRNLSSHVYSHDYARDIYQRLPSYLSVMQETYLSLTERFGGEA